MTEKRYNVWDINGTIFLEDHKDGSYHIGQVENVDINCLNDIANRLNDLTEDIEYLEKRFKEEEWHYDHIDEDRDAWRHKCQELEKENKKLKKENDKIKSLLFQKIKELNDDYEKSAKAGMPTGGIIGELDSFEEICEEMGWSKQTNKVNDEKYKCHVCKHLHNDKTLKLCCDINGVDFLKKYYDCKNFEDYRNFR